MKAMQISVALANQVDLIVQHLLPAGKRAGNYWQAGDVTGGAGTSLYVHLSGRHCGQWRDAATGEGGDLLDLIALQHDVSIADAMKLALEWLGKGDLSPVEPVHAKKPDNDTQKAAVALWQRSRPLMDAYGAQGQAYFTNRGIDPSGFEDLRFHHAAWLKIDGQKIECPAIIAAIRDECGSLQAIHRTFLDPDQPIKAKFSDPKRALGQLTGGACWLRRHGQCLIVAEGIETAMSLGVMFSGAAIAAGITAHHLTVIKIPKRFERVMIAADNDDAGRRAAAELTDRLDGRNVIIVYPQHSDFNDDLVTAGQALTKKSIVDQIKSIKMRREE